MKYARALYNNRTGEFNMSMFFGFERDINPDGGNFEFGINFPDYQMKYFNSPV